MTRRLLLGLLWIAVQISRPLPDLSEQREYLLDRAAHGWEIGDRVGFLLGTLAIVSGMLAGLLIFFLLFSRL